MKRRIMSLVIGMSILLLALFTGAVGAQPAPTPILYKDGYTSVAENDRFTMYADLKTGDFALFDVQTSKVWYSGQWDVLNDEHPASQLNSGRIKTDLVSLIAVNYVQISTIASTAVPSYQNSYAYCVIKDNVKVSRIKNGYKAEFYFADIDSTVPVEITLTKDGINAEIIGKEIKQGKEYWITSVELLPGFMASDDRYEGYLFVPSGSGGIIDLNAGKGDLATYNEMVYGEDAAIEVDEHKGEKADILVPVYGIKCGDDAITAIITKGDATASINAESNSATSSFSRIFSEYITAIVDSTTLFESNYENQRTIYGIEKRKSFENYCVSFTVLRGKEADYSGMAKVYRDSLIEKGLEKKATPPKLNLTLYGAATRKASFLGIPYTKTISLTSFSEAGKILEVLNAKDIPVALQYVGWNNSGIENKKAMTKYAPVSVLGGKSGLKNLIKVSEAADNTLFLEVDFVTLRKSGHGFSVLSDVSKSIFNTRTPQYKYMRSVYVPVNNENPWYLLTGGNALQAAKKFAKRTDIAAGYSIFGAGEMLYSDFSKKGTDRKTTIKNYVKMMDTFKDKETSVDKGYAYIYPYTDHIYALPTTNDGNLLFSRSVPFVQMVLHGYLPYSALSSSDLLTCIELGADPYFYAIYENDSNLIETTFNWLYGSTYKNSAEKMKDVFKKYNAVYKDLYDKTIVSHTNENGISKTTFENGTQIWVNRTGQDVSADGITIKNNDFTVIGG